MADDLFIGTRKGLFKFERIDGKWQQTYLAFLGAPVTARQWHLAHSFVIDQTGRKNTNRNKIQQVG